MPVILERPFFTTKVASKARGALPRSLPLSWLSTVDRASKRKVRILPERRKKVSGIKVGSDDYMEYDSRLANANLSSSGSS